MSPSALTSDAPHDAGPLDDRREWEAVVDATLHEAWSVTMDAGLGRDQAASVCEVVYLRLLERQRREPRPVDELVDVVRSIARTEAARYHRLAGWRAAAAGIAV